jgi:hypothetical protein
VGHGPRESIKSPDGHDIKAPLMGVSHQQWAILMYKHIDHHLRQFGV